MYASSHSALRAGVLVVLVCLAVGFGVATVGATQEEQFEPNDDFDTATPIEPGEYQNRTITEGDLDFYAIDLARGESLSATITFSNEVGNLDLFLLGPDRTLRRLSTGTTDREALSYVAAENGTYYVVVAGFANATGSYDLRVARGTGGQVSGGDRFEPNDDFGSATPLGPGEYSELNVTGSDLDYYAVDLNRSEPVSARIEFSNDVGDLDLALLSPNGTLLQVGNSVGDEERVSAAATENGTHYVVVYGFQGGTGPYNLTLSKADGQASRGDRFEPNDDVRQATSLEPGRYSGLNITAGDRDVFAFELESGQTFSGSINFSNAAGDLDLELLGPNLELLDASASTNDVENVSTVAAAPGSYYLVVYGFGDATGPYNLSASVGGAGPSPGGDRFEPNDGFETARVLESGRYRGLNISRNDTDFFAVELDAGQRLSTAIDFSDQRGDLDLYVFDPNRQLVGLSTGTADRENVSYVVGRSGTHYVVVAGYEGSIGPYELTIATAGDDDRPPAGEREPNDDFDSATPIDPGTVSGNVTEGDVDVYAVEVGETEGLSGLLEFDGARADLDLFLVGPDRQIIQSSVSTGYSEKVSALTSDSGTHYVVVYGFTNATGSYELTVTRTGGVEESGSG